MLKLRTLLLYDYVYYCILVVAIMYVIFNVTFISNKSIYNNITKFVGIITSIESDCNKTKLIIKNKESIIGYIYNNLSIDASIYNIGDTINVEGEEIALNDNTNPNAFNYKKYLSNKNIFHIVSINNISRIKENENIFYKIKNFFIKRSYKLLLSYPYINSLILGNNNYIDDDILTSYRENGISHLFAISGLHVSLFIMILAFVMKKIKVKENARYIVIILFLLLYMFLTNFSMSVMRAGLFTILLIINKIFYFYVKPVNILLLALSIIIFINPRSVFDIGLQYSFSISFFLLFFQEMIKGKNYIITLLYTSTIAFIVSFPITIYNFYQVNILSIFYNLVFVPYLSFIILPLTIISFIFPFLDKILYFLLLIMERLSLLLSRINISKLIFAKPSIFILILYYIIIFIVLYLWLQNKKRYIWVFIVFAMVHYFVPNFINENYYLMFDVGQGDSSLLIVNNNVLLIDTGGTIPFNNIYNPSRSKNIIIPYLKSKGIKKIDTLVLTHGDSDHMQDSLYLVNNFKVNNVILNVGKYNDLELELIEILRSKGIKYYQDISKINTDKYSIDILNTSILDNENDNSTVIYFNIDGTKILLMGDAGISKEQLILDKYDITDIDILKVGHHGSNTSSGKHFISKIKPKNCLISVGNNNKFGHPNQNVLKILNNCNIYRTDINGSIKIILEENKYYLKSFK